MGGLFSPAARPQPQTAPVMPTLSDTAVQQAADESAKARQRQGRASTILTNPQAQREADASHQSYLSGV